MASYSLLGASRRQETSGSGTKDSLLFTVIAIVCISEFCPRKHKSHFAQSDIKWSYDTYITRKGTLVREAQTFIKGS